MNAHNVSNEGSNLGVKMGNDSPKTRRGLTLYDENPFVNPEMIDTVKTRVKRQNNRKGDMYVRAADDSVVGSAAGFWQSYEVESTQFIKLFIRGVGAFKELTNAGIKVFEILYIAMQKAIGQDRVWLSFTSIEKNPDFPIKLSQTTFTRGMRELIDKGFLAPTIDLNWYWINPNYMFNGDRLVLVQEYRRKSEGKKSKPQVPGQTEIDLLALLGEGEKVNE